MARLSTVMLIGVLALLLVVPASAQDDAQMSITVSDQVLAVNGLVTIESVTVPEAGWLAVHAVVDGQLGPTVGIAPLQAGENPNVQVIVDTLGATPESAVVLHADTGQTGVYEFDMMPDTDPMLMQNDQPAQATFQLTALTVFPQMLQNDIALVGSVITPQNAWVVISADNNGQAGTVLGSAPVPTGTIPAVAVPVSAEGRTENLWVALHTDDGTVGTFEFDGQSGLDAPLMVNDTPASAPLQTAQAPVVMTAFGAPLETDTAPAFEVAGQEAMGDGTSGTLLISRVLSPVPGWMEVHADSMGHPGKALGLVNVAEGENADLSIPLDPMMMPAAPPPTITPVVWPMLHIDDNQQGVYEYLMVPGADAPIVVNGLVLTSVVSIGSQDATGADTTGAGVEATPEETPVG